jgi:hypothetical protein
MLTHSAWWNKLLNLTFSSGLEGLLAVLMGDGEMRSQGEVHDCA